MLVPGRSAPSSPVVVAAAAVSAIVETMVAVSVVGVVVGVVVGCRHCQTLTLVVRCCRR